MEKAIEQQKKRHHYVPQAYLRAFCNHTGHLRVYRKDEPAKVLPLTPNNTGHRRSYYAQPLSNGAMDNNTLENIFSDIEGKWPAIVEKLQEGQNINDSLLDLFQFMALQRVRVPASRDANEAKLAALVKTTFFQLHAEGKLPEVPDSLAGRLNEISVAIDPHRSIHAMVEDLDTEVVEVFDRVGLRAIRNQTDLPFLTSDNPVIWFDPSVPPADETPYAINKSGPVMLFFPVSPQVLIVGHTEAKERFSRYGLEYGEAPSAEWVEWVNLQVCRYAYETVYASKPGQEDLILAFADESPVYSETNKGLVFGPRPDKPKWD